MAGQLGTRPALMEDLATARISTAQTAQRLLHESPCQDTGRRHSPAMVKEILGAECADILPGWVTLVNWDSALATNTHTV